MGKQFQNDSRKDVRVAATAWIWVTATGMLGICIPLTAIADSGPILPLAVLTGAAFSTSTIWRSSEQKSHSNTLSPINAEALEERVTNLETIVGNEEINFQRRLQQLDPKDKVTSD